MANPVGVNGGSLQINYGLASQDYAGNYSVINWNLQLLNTGGDGGSSYFNWNFQYPWNNAINSGSGGWIYARNNTVFAGGSFVHYHNSDGTSGNINVGGWFQWYNGSGTANASFQVATIPRNVNYLNSTPYAESITKSQFNVAVLPDATCDNLATSLDGAGWAYWGGDFNSWRVVTLGGSFSSGTTHTFKTSIRRKDSQLWTESAVKSVTTTQHSISNFVAGEITDTNFKVYYNIDDTCDWAQYSLDGGAWVDLPSPAQLVGVNLKSDTQYSVKIRTRATVSQKWSESSSINVTTLSQNKFMDFFDDRFGKAGL